MIGFKAYRTTPTTLDLNGPILSYTKQPVGLTTDSSTINLVGIATALPVGTGSISYQWYETGHGPIATSSTITGTATTTLTLNELNYNDSGREFYLEAGYNPSAYGTSDPITAGTARSTGNAVNAPLVSDTAEITVGPTIVILQQPVSATTVVGQDQNFSVLASIGSSTGAGIPSPCIAVRNQSDGATQATINDDWTTFRNRWPSRPFNIFRVRNEGNNTAGNVILPSVDPTDYILKNVNRDNGNVAAAEDWFNLANLGDYPRGITVTLTIDVSQPNTGMTFSDVEASYNKFVEDCAEAGIIIEYSDGLTATASDGTAADGTRYVAVTPGRYIYPFIYKLVGSDANTGDPNLFYQWKVDGENPVNYSRPGNELRQVENASTRILTITQSPAGIHTVACSVSYEGANNSPLLSNVVNFDVVADTTPRSVLHLEEFDVNATLYNTKVVNLEDEALEIIPSSSLSPTSNWNRIYSINAPEKDVTVKITMKAASGGGGNAVQSTINFLLSGEQQGTDPWSTRGGEGGVSVWTMTLTKQQEYVVNLGARISPSGGIGVPLGGAIQATIGGGGGGSFFYRGGELLVACGGGGGGGYRGRGITGWYSIASEQGKPGNGGGIGPDPNLTSIGEFAGGLSSPGLRGNSGGRVARCTIGNYWATQGIPPCGSIGSTQVFTGKDGQESTSIFTTPVIRGYKAGENYQFNGGNGTGGGAGGGGGGAQGGRGGIHPSEGGLGGLGFAVIPIDSATVGGHNGLVGTIKIEAV